MSHVRLDSDGPYRTITLAHPEKRGGHLQLEQRQLDRVLVNDDEQRRISTQQR